MERDFLGLSSMNVQITAKEEVVDDSNNQAPVRVSGMQWSFSNKVTAVPQLLSFKTAQDERQRKPVFDPLASTGFMTLSTTNSFDATQKPFSSVIQKNVFLDTKAGSQHGKTSYPFQSFNANSVHRPQEIKIFPAFEQPNQTLPVALSSSILQSQLVSTGQNVGGSIVKPQTHVAPLAGLNCASSIIGTTDPRISSKSSSSSTQLTIFYAGSVCIYDDVSPEKAQAIMLLASSSSSQSEKKPLYNSQMQAPFHAGDSFGSTSQTASPTLGLPTPISLMSHTGSRTGGGSASTTNELAAVQPIGPLSPPNYSEPTKLGSSSTFIPSAVPQARKASLARFLEKRKERIMNTSPYSVMTNSSAYGTPKSESLNFHINATGSSPLSGVKLAH